MFLDSRTMLLSAKCIFSTMISSVIQHLELHNIKAMTNCQSPDTRTAPKISAGINSLIAAANKHDRFKLLEDDGVPAADLKNHIHPLLKWFDVDGPMRQMLLLASQFLAHDSVLTFFVPLIYGHELATTVNGVHKIYLSNPFTNASDARRSKLIKGTREALHCLAHSIRFKWIKTDKRVYARTMVTSIRPVHEPFCCTAFQRKVTPKIEINNRFKRFYIEENGYITSSRCAKFRHDFLLASTIVHELVHAVGMMRRGHTNEEWIRLDHPSTEWGYAWEHFMFGFIINPQDRDQIGTNLLMKKVWADGKVAENAGGKEYSTVPMSYIAQWFRQETWDIIADQGPSAIPPPVSHFKIQCSQKCGAWIISTDNLSIKPDIVALYMLWKQQRRNLETRGTTEATSIEILWRSQSKESMLSHNVTTPIRTPWDAKQCPNRGLKLQVSKVTDAKLKETLKRYYAVEYATPSNASIISRKRHTEEESGVIGIGKKMKR